MIRNYLKHGVEKHPRLRDNEQDVLQLELATVDLDADVLDFDHQHQRGRDAKREEDALQDVYLHKRSAGGMHNKNAARSIDLCALAPTAPGPCGGGGGGGTRRRDQITWITAA